MTKQVSALKRLGGFFSKHQCCQPVAALVEAIGLDPRCRIVIDDFSRVAGTYTAYLNTSQVRAGDIVTVSILVRPNKDEKPLLAVKETIRNGEEVYWFRQGPCAGIEIIFEMTAGRPVVVPVTVWRSTCQS